MKQKIYYKLLADVDKPEIFVCGDWIDLRCAKNTIVGDEPVTYIPLGIAMRLPKGFEAILVGRSSTPKNFNIWCPISFGVIDNSYNGDNDEWKFPATPIGQPRTMVKKNERICQFRIQLSQKATWWQKIKWMLSSGIELVEVEHLATKNRGGIGTTGKV